MREGNDQQRLDPQVTQDLFFLREGKDLLGNPIRSYDREWMGMEGDDRGRSAELTRTGNDTSDDLLMADVQAIEVADGRYTASREVSLFERIVENEHREFMTSSPRRATS